MFEHGAADRLVQGPELGEHSTMARVGSHNSVSSSDFAQPKWRPGLVGPTSYHWTAWRVWSSWAARFERAESALTARTGQQHMSSRKRFAAMSARSTGVAQRWRRHEGARAGAGFDGSGQRTCVIRNGPDSSDASRRRICGLGVRAGVVEAPRVAAVAVALRGYDRSPRQEPRQKPQRSWEDLWVLPISSDRSIDRGR